MTNQVSKYPGEGSTVMQMLSLADEYYSASILLIRHKAHSPSLFAPARLCVLQAIEVYLNSYLLFCGMTPKDIRTFRHLLNDRVIAAQKLGLELAPETHESLTKLEKSREYLLVRYGPERESELSDLPDLFNTLDDVTRKVRKVILQVT
ncbi:MAG: hypothetical protein NTX73_07210 [Rhodobacterales bacterium]|nr:hypothetical protein [Rhodobacterales bacterium]